MPENSKTMPKAAPKPLPARFSRKPGGVKVFALTDAMIERRGKLATALGYVLRPCSLGSGRDCWERPALDYVWRGKKVSGFHAVPTLEGPAWGQPREGVEYYWPEDAATAAFAVDKGKPLPGDNADGSESAESQGRLSP